MSATFKIDTREFDRTLKKYAELSKRDAATIVNTKAFYIARGASRETYRPSKEKIKRDLEAIIKTTKVSKSGKSRKVNKKNADGVPIVALLINWKRGKLAKPGLFGQAMKEAIKTFIRRRQQARAYMASGWNPAIKAFEPLAKKSKSVPPRDTDAMKIKGTHGAFSVAKPGEKAIARLINFAFALHSTTKSPDMKVAQPALQRAIDAETVSMKEEIERRLRATAKEIGIRTN